MTLAKTWERACWQLGNSLTAVISKERDRLELIDLRSKRSRCHYFNNSSQLWDPFAQGFFLGHSHPCSLTWFRFIFMLFQQILHAHRFKLTYIVIKAANNFSTNWERTSSGIYSGLLGRNRWQRTWTGASCWSDYNHMIINLKDLKWLCTLWWSRLGRWSGRWTPSSSGGRRGWSRWRRRASSTSWPGGIFSTINPPSWWSQWCSGTKWMWVDLAQVRSCHCVKPGWQKLAAFRRGQKWTWKFSADTFLLFSRQMRCFCV